MLPGAGVYTENGTMYLIGTSLKEAVPADANQPMSPKNQAYLSRWERDL